MKRETPREKVERLLTTVPRPFIIRINGTWTLAQGVYLHPLKPPFPVRCVYNGRFVYVEDNKRYFDFISYDESSTENFIIQKNINSFPKPKSMVEETPRFYRTYIRPTAYRVVEAEPTPAPVIRDPVPAPPTEAEANERAAREFIAFFENTTPVVIQPAAPIINPQDPPPPVTPATGIVERVRADEFDPMPYIPFQVTPDLPTPNTH